MLNAKTVKRASKMVIEIELRSAWSEVECTVRHGGQPSKRLSDYIVLLTRALQTAA